MTGRVNEYGQTAEQLERAAAWLDRSRKWLAERPGETEYPCECPECRQLELPGVSP